MADTQSFQPPRDAAFDRLEQSLEQWREHLTRLSSTLPPNETTKLSRQWDHLRQVFDVACLHHGFNTGSLQAVLEPLPLLKDCHQDELEMTAEALQLAKKTLGAMLSETKSRAGLLEEALATDKPQRIRKSLDKMRAIESLLHTRLLGLDAYVEQFKLAEIPEQGLLASAENMLAQTTRIGALSEKNAELQMQTEQMKRWLASAQLNLDRMPIEPPPSPGAMQQLSLSVQAKGEADEALVSLYTSHEKLKNARQYLEDFLNEKEKD